MSVAVLSVARPKVNFICDASGSRRYFRNVPYLSYSLCLLRQFCHGKTGGKRCWKKCTHAFFLQLIRSNRFFFFFSEKAAQSKMFWGRFKRSPTKSFPKLVLLGARKYARPPHRKIQPEGSAWNLCVLPDIYYFSSVVWFQGFFWSFPQWCNVSAC